MKPNTPLTISRRDLWNIGNLAACHDTYGVQVAPGGDTLLVLAVAVALDIMTNPD